MDQLKRYIIRRRERKNFLKLRKMIRYREHVIKEIMKTEENFVNDIDIITTFRDSIQGQIQAYHDNLIFQNIDAILQNNKAFYTSLKSYYQNYYIWKPIFSQQVRGFQVYFQYCKGYQDSEKCVKTLTDDDFNFKSQLSSKCFRGMQLQDFLVKPVQRLPKYVLLFKDLLKNTPAEHPDYLNIENLLTEFLKLNDENNQSMDKYMNRLQIKDLAVELNRADLVGPQTRLLLTQESRKILIEKQELEVLAYYFNDLIMVVNAKKIISMINLDSQSVIKSYNDMKNYQTVYSLVGKDGTLQFIADTPMLKEKEMAQLTKILDYIRKNDGTYRILVTVLGTREIDNFSLTKHTEYIIEVQIEKIAVKVYLRFKEMVTLSKYCQNHFQNISMAYSQSSTWLRNHDTKVIEQRQIAIENFIQLVLTHDQTKDNVYILEALGLPSTFYTLPLQNVFLDQDVKHAFMSQIKYKQQEEQSLSSLLKNYLENQHSNHLNISEMLETITYDKYGQAIQTENSLIVHLPDGSEHNVYIQLDTRAYEVVRVLSQIIDLKFFEDFKLFEIDEFNNRRVIDDDELIIKVINQKKSLIQKIEGMVTAAQQKKIILGKYIHVKQIQEEIDIRDDPVRLRIIVYQVFEDIYQKRYLLTVNELCLFSALYIKISKIQFSDEAIQKIIPWQTYKTLKPKEWNNQTSQILQTLNKDIYNYISQEKSEDYLSQIVVYNAIKSNEFYGSNLYYIDLGSTIKDQTYPNAYLALNLDKISLHNPQTKKPFMLLKYSEIEEVKSFPNKLRFSYENIKWSIRTVQSYEIKMMILLYKSMNQYFNH